MSDSQRQPQDPMEYMHKVRTRTAAAIPYAFVVVVLAAVIDQLTLGSPLLDSEMMIYLAATGLISLFVIKPHVNCAFDRWFVIVHCVVGAVLFNATFLPML